MTQEERRVYLIEYLLKELGYNNEIPKNEEDQRALLRALMNVRMPGKIGANFLTIQDEYLSERAKEKGIVDVDDLEPIQDHLYVWRGDITRLKANAIVNACNSGLTGCYTPNHSCIDNQIHTFSGVQLRKKCADLTGGYPEPTGRARITPAYNLPADYVIHTVGTICHGMVTPQNIQELKSCYWSCMEIAEEYNLKSIVFCCISTGIFGFPQRQAAKIAVQTIKNYLATGSSIKKIVFNVFKSEDESFYLEILKN